MTTLAPSPSRVRAITSRNISALRSGPEYWVTVLSGVFEPLMYMLAMGVGLGSLMTSGHWTVDGKEVSYLQYIAPAMLASAAMSGAVSETLIHFFFKLRYQHTFEGMLATPIRPVDIVAGELLWALIRSAAYIAVFLAVIATLGVTTPARALVVFPAGFLVSFAFGALGMVVATRLRGPQDFDAVVVGQLALFLFSGAFAPLSRYPEPLHTLAALLPLYHGVELVRGTAFGHLSLALAGHAAYLLALGVGCLTWTARRIELGDD
ncbi:transport permease protein [Streptomyces albospinus]|uniref:Transport permease protein n=1 Tax=Streptomyces albospinus TaxID=285515 RepID=A0ABQ2VS11_9ACTN|nr:ABC transporter permease [Streptomyces albospinus]GGV02230.1 transport permease protein [Streptomyces albospinus]